MLKQVGIGNFFSFGEQEITLIPGVNILVGINGSGKSNFIKAIQLLYEGVAGARGIEKLLQDEWGGIANFGNFSQAVAEKILLEYHLDDTGIQEAAQIREVDLFLSAPTYSIGFDRKGESAFDISEGLSGIIKSQNKRWRRDFIKYSQNQGLIREAVPDGRIALTEFSSGKEAFGFKENELILRQLSDPISFAPQLSVKRAIEEIVVYEYFNTSPGSPIRQLSPYSSEKKLLPNGENLVRVLQRMKNHHPLHYEHIEENLSKINPNFKDISFEPIGNRFMLVLREKKLARSVPIESISDGTLRYLLLLAIVFNPDRGKLICLDEPDTGLHPDMIRTIAEGIKKAAREGTQFIIATHNPLFLNHFELDDILIFEKDADNQTIVSSKSEEDFEDWQDHYLAGQLWLSGKLGGTRW